MKSKRRWLAGILSVVMTMTFMPAYAFAGEAAESGNNKDAAWKVVIDDGDPELWCYYYDTLQEAMDHEYGSGDAQIILNRDREKAVLGSMVRIMTSILMGTPIP